RCEPQSNRTSEPAPIRTRHGCSYNQYPALGFNTPERDLVLPVGAPHRCEPQSSQDSEPAAHSHPTRVLLQSISGVAVQYPGKGSGFTCRSTASVRTAIKPNLKASPHSHPTRVLLRWIRGGEVCVGAPPSVRTGQAHTRTRGGCSYNKYANSHPWRLLLQN